MMAKTLIILAAICISLSVFQQAQAKPAVDDMIPDHPPYEADSTMTDVTVSNGLIVSKFIDLGASDDPEDDYNNSRIRIERLEGPDWDSYWTQMDMYRENPALIDGWYPYADLTDLPGQEREWVTMRMIRGFFKGQFFANSDGFTVINGKNGTPLYLTIRYKDINLDPALDRFWGTGANPEEGPGVSVNGCPDGDGCDDSSQWIELGNLGGGHDFNWKTETLEIPISTIAVVGNEFKFRISPALWGASDLYGEISIDWIRVSTIDSRPIGVGYDEPYDVEEGFWPAVQMNPNFVDLAETGFLQEGQPFFPIGLFTATTHFYWESDTNNYLTNAHDTGFNFVVYNGWEAHSSSGGWFWGSKDQQATEYFSIGAGESTPYPARYLGLPNFLDKAEEYGLMVAPWWNTDTYRAYINTMGENPGDDSLYGYPNSPYNGTFPGVVEAVQDVVEANKDHSAILLWFIKDEGDHDDEWWGSPVESVRWMYKAVTETDGAHPCLVNNMGWRPLMFRHFMNTFDIGAYDRYTSSLDGPVAHDEVAEWAEEFHYQTDNERMLITIIETSQQVAEGCFNDIETVRIASYLALIHGAQGLLFFDDPGPNADLSVYDSCGSCCGPQWWDSLSQLLTEFNELAYTALHNSVAETIGYVWGDSHGSDLYPLEHTVWGDGITDDTRIHALFRRNIDTQDRYLISINAYTQEATATFSVSGLNAGDEVQVLFENRSITADDGTFSDQFGTGQRHVYYFPGRTHDFQ